MSSISVNFDICLKCLEADLLCQHENEKASRQIVAIFFSLPCIWIYLLISQHREIPSVYAIYTKLITLHYFLLLCLKCDNYLKLYCSEVEQMPSLPFGFKIIFGVKESTNGFNLKISLVKGNIQEIYRKHEETEKKNKQKTNQSHFPILLLCLS